MSRGKSWTDQELLIAFGLYCQLPFGKLHSRNPEIIKYAERIGRTPSALAMKLSNIASLDPAITSTGRKGLSGASSSDKKMWEAMENNWEGFALETEQALASTDQVTSLDSKGHEKTEKDNYIGLDKVIKSKARVGQHFFRKTVLSSYNNRCCITGLANPSLLIASHIVPWRSDEKNRLNPRNGLSLSMLHDKAFDLGLITITDDMTVRISKTYSSDTDHFFNLALNDYENKPIELPEKFSPHPDFLAYHRDHIFQG